MRQSMVMGLIAVVMIAATGMSQSPANYADAPAAHWHDIDSDVLRAFKNPMEGLEMGLDLRLREVYAQNMVTVSDDEGDRHYQRVRPRWSTKWTLDEDITFNTRLTWEFWNYCKPEGLRSTDFNEAIFDIMNIQFRNAFDLPLTLTVGRQDIILGTGWLVLDGTPADGSRTTFFDAVRGTYQLTDTAKLDMIFIQQYDDESKWLKPFNHGAVRDSRHLTQNQDEKAVILYLTNNVSENFGFDAYYMFKKDKESGLARHYGRTGDDQETNVIGGRVFGNLDDHWSYSVEGAYQFGRFRPNGGEFVDQRAFGTNNKLQYSFHDEWRNEIHIGYEYLSGDDTGTGKNERFNTMWGDWPQTQRGGDLQSYIWSAEGNTGEVSNLHRLGVGHSFKPHQNWTMATDYNLLWADENSERGTTEGYSNSGNFRGHMLTGLLTYQCCKNFRTQFLLDYFIPGGYYETPRGDQAYFARVNMEWTF
ncbi:MAG: alginate export family protein [Phycisphaerae bacterium]|nr:alginate export family protein [Phycisphaerae bacterium]